MKCLGFPSFPQLQATDNRGQTVLHKAASSDAKKVIGVLRTGLKADDIIALDGNVSKIYLQNKFKEISTKYLKV